MAAAKTRPAKVGGGKKAVRGRMPVKRSINLVLVDDNKINPLKAILGILAIIVLAALFSKFLVMDRLVAVAHANNRVSRMNADLKEARAAMADYGDIEQAYAHYTYAGMTQAEMNLVDRTRIMQLVGRIFDSEVKSMTPAEYWAEMSKLLDMFRAENAPFDKAEFDRQFEALTVACQPVERLEKTWEVTGNLLTVEMTGESLEALGKLAQEVESSPIVDSCTIITANKGVKVSVARGVWAKLIIYLTQPVEEVAES